MDEKKQEQFEVRAMIDTPDGGSVCLPTSEMDAWRRGQEQLKQGDPEALKRLEQLQEEGQRFLEEMISKALKAKE